MLRRVLIANRGEIACRIARTCRRLGIGYVAVYTDADASSPHLEGAAEAIRIGPGPAASSYLDARRLVEVALETSCDSVHPGYGFLSENDAFAAAVIAAGLRFIGPKPETIAALGDKARAKALMAAAGVPVVPGGEGASDDPAAVEAMVGAVGLPVLLKPTAGGGGKGMQVLRDHAGLADAVASAIRIARSSFGDGRLIVERYVERPRHVEVQVFGDAEGDVVHLFERECSLQRRHQKVVEEAPAPGLPPEVRQRLLDAAVRGARSVGYVNAGTFEFILGENNEFYFLEVNTRLQVEHPVTEVVTGLDLVEWQLRVAAGEPLPLGQDGIRCDGHAVECRVYAEDPSRDFQPAPGRAGAVVWPDSVRVEAGLVQGGEVPPFYDPMVAKLIAGGRDRDDALGVMRDALERTVLLGLTTNLGYLSRLLADPGVRAGRTHTRYLDEHSDRFAVRASAPAAAGCAAAIALPMLPCGSPWGPGSAAGTADRGHLDPDAPAGRLEIWLDDAPVSCALRSVAPGRLQVEVAGRLCEVEVGGSPGDAIRTGRSDQGSWHAVRLGAAWELQVNGDRFSVQFAQQRSHGEDASVRPATAPMSGTVAALPVRPGLQVAAGDVLAVIEAMKMEHRIVAQFAGTVRAIAYAVGDTVKAGDLIVDVEPSN